MTCARCGCTDYEACVHGEIVCWWVGPSLCSFCAYGAVRNETVHLRPVEVIAPTGGLL